jgi:hypothetical protein
MAIPFHQQGAGESGLPLGQEANFSGGADRPLAADAQKSLVLTGAIQMALMDETF